MTGFLLTAGAACLGISVYLARRARPRWLRRVLLGTLLLPGVVLLGAGGVLLWFTNRPQPPAVERPLFEGILYQRATRREPRPLVIHVARIDLTAPGIGLLVTPPDHPTSGLPLKARTVTDFAREYDVQLAINGDFFRPFWTRGLLDFYPRRGDPVDVFGFASAHGVAYSDDVPPYPTVFFTADNRVLFDPPTPPDPINHAISGNTMLLRDGVIDAHSDDDYLTRLHPRTAIGLDATGTTLLLFVVDGRQPNYSEGVTLVEMAHIAAEFGAHQALNLDGGGSSALVMRAASGQAITLNTPIDQRIPGRERPVANHLGVFADRLG